MENCYLYDKKNISFSKNIIPPYLSNYPYDINYKNLISIKKENFQNYKNNILKKIIIDNTNIDNLENIIYKKNTLYYLDINNFIVNQNINDNIKIVINKIKKLIKNDFYIGIVINNPLIYYLFCNIIIFFVIECSDIKNYYQLLSKDNIFYHYKCVCNLPNYSCSKDRFLEKIKNPQKFIGLNDDGIITYYESKGNNNIF